MVHLPRGDFERGVSVLRRGLAMCQSRELRLGSGLIGPFSGADLPAPAFRRSTRAARRIERRLNALPLLAAPASERTSVRKATGETPA